MPCRSFVRSFVRSSTTKKGKRYGKKERREVTNVKKALGSAKKRGRGRDWKIRTNLGKSLTPTLMMSVDLKKGGDLQPPSRQGEQA